MRRISKTSHDKAYVCIHVFQDQRPVLLVSRPDGDWCFLCGDLHPADADAYRVIGVGHLLQLDESLDDVSDLEPDWEAERESPTGKWVRTRIEDAG